MPNYEEQLLAARHKYRDRFVIDVYWDDDPPNPRKEWDNSGTLVIWDKYEPNPIISDEVPSWSLEDHPKMVALSAQADAFGDYHFDEVPEREVSAYYEDGEILMIPIFGRNPYSIFDPLPTYHMDRDMVSGYIHMSRRDILDEFKWAPDPQLAFSFMGGQKILQNEATMYEEAVRRMEMELESLNYFCEGQCMGYTVKDMKGVKLWQTEPDVIMQSWGYLGYSEDELVKTACHEIEAHYPTSDNFKGNFNKALSKLDTVQGKGIQVRKTLTKLPL